MLSCPLYGNNPLAVGFDKLDVDTERERLRKLIPKQPQDSSHFEIASDNPCRLNWSLQHHLIN